jgi:hypothetical protein
VSVPSIMLSVSLGTDSQWVNYTLAGGVLLWHHALCHRTSADYWISRYS